MCRQMLTLRLILILTVILMITGAGVYVAQAFAANNSGDPLVIATAPALMILALAALVAAVITITSLMAMGRIRDCEGVLRNCGDEFNRFSNAYDALLVTINVAITTIIANLLISGIPSVGTPGILISGLAVTTALFASTILFTRAWALRECVS